MGDIEQRLYDQSDRVGFDHASALARTILKSGLKLGRDCYQYRGQRYWIVNGRCLTREQGEALEDERRREGRLVHPSDRGQKER